MMENKITKIDDDTLLLTAYQEREVKIKKADILAQIEANKGSEAKRDAELKEQLAMFDGE